jgi:hypothetical protein
LAVIGGKVTIASLTIEDTAAKGGDGSASGGGGGGLGGGLFVGPLATVALTNVSFTGDAANGGNGGAGGGGGAGGNASVLVPPLGIGGTSGTRGTHGKNELNPNGEPGGAGGAGGNGKPGGFGKDGGAGGTGGIGGDGAYGGGSTGPVPGTGGAGAVGGKGGGGGTGGHGGDGGDGGGGGDGGRGEFGAGSGPGKTGATGGASAEAGAGGTGGYLGGGGGGGDGGDGGSGGAGGTAGGHAGAGGHGADGSTGGLGGLGGFGGGGGGGGNGGRGGDGGDGGIGESTRGHGGAGGAGGDGGNGATGGGGGFGGGGGGGGHGGTAGDGGPPGTARNGAAPGTASGNPGSAGKAGFGNFGGFGGGGAQGGSRGGEGGGGLGAGGDIFIAQGGTLTIDGGLLANGTVKGGTGAQDGGAYGSGIFIQGTETITLAAPTTETLTVSGVIADQKGSGGTGANAVMGALDIAGTGTVALDADNTFQGGITIQSGTLELAHTGAAGGGNIGFDPGVLTFAAADAPANAIDNFLAGDSIVVTGFTATGHTYAGDTLVLDSAGAPVDLVMPGLDAAKLQVTTAGGDTTVSIACFAAGTRIATARGEVPVEQLRPGDRVRTVRGRLRPVVWLGHRTLDCRHHPRPHDVLPVRIAPHAFGANRPARPLFLSPDHAALVNGALIPIRYLVNGASIAQVEVDRIAYWHVELAGHAVLFAEGLACESYLDTGNRAAFANGGSVIEAHPDFARRVWQSAGCAPLVTAGPALARAKSGLLTRLPRLGYGVTTDPALSLALDGTPLTPTRDGEWLCLHFPDGAATLTLDSRIGRPAELDADSTDTRPLGIALRALRLDGVDTPLDHPCLTAGWHDPEPGWRWTCGNATLDLRGRRRAELAVTTWLRYHVSKVGALPQTLPKAMPLETVCLK